MNTSSPSLVGSPPDASPAAWDFILVGGGTSGCVLASRLAERHPTLRILVLENGPDARNPHPPRDWKGNFYPGAPLDYDYFATQRAVAAEAQTAGSSSASERAREHRILRGKVLGGTSVVNAMIWHRGYAHDWDGWKDLSGYDGWAWKDIEPLFARIEACDVDSVPDSTGAPGAPAPRGREGAIAISAAKIRNHPVPLEFVAACERHGTPLRPTPNSPHQPLGASYNEFTVDATRAERTTARDYLQRPAVASNPNLEVRVGTAVARVLFDGTTAIGVEALDHATGAVTTLRARREVILCAGAIGTPHVLLLSGVGPREHLAEVGVPCVVDLPGVGSALADHIGFFVDFRVDTAWAQRQRVSFDSSVGTDLSAFLSVTPRPDGTFAARHDPRPPRAPRPAPGVEPNAQVEFFTWNRYSPYTVRFSHYMGILPNPYFSAMLERMGAKNPLTGDGPANAIDLQSVPTMGFLIGLTRPRDVGSVRLASADPGVKPAIETRYFQSDEDVAEGIAAIRHVRAVAATMGCGGDEIYPGAHLRTDLELSHFVRSVAQSKHHAASSCRMADRSRDPLGVVDGTLAVHGCRNLRIVDCSILPELPVANTQAIAYAVGEKAADLISATL
jgi:choline dehydrogenase